MHVDNALLFSSFGILTARIGCSVLGPGVNHTELYFRFRLAFFPISIIAYNGRKENTAVVVAVAAMP